MANKQTQKAGDGAQQLQAKQMIFNCGIDEKRVREIFKEQSLQLRKEYSQEALKIANYRVTQFENSLMTKMTAIEGVLGAFEDPSFQLLLVEAQKTAAATERPADYDLLSELLIHRFQKGEDRVTRAGINRAVEIVDKVDGAALIGLTVFYCTRNFTPLSGDIIRGLKILNDLLSKIIYAPLPSGTDWLDHLDILDAVRLNLGGSLKKIEIFFSEKLFGYIDVGIEKKSENYNKALALLDSKRLSRNFLVEHLFNPSFVRLNIPNTTVINSLVIKNNIIQNGQSSIQTRTITEEEKGVIKSIYALYKQDSEIKQKNIKKFMLEWDKQPYLKKLRYWYDNLTIAFNLTSVGRVLAHSNAQRCDKDFPSLSI